MRLTCVRVTLLFISVGALVAMMGCAAMEIMGGELASPFADMAAEAKMIRKLDCPLEESGVLLVNAAIRDDPGDEETHSIYAATIINVADPESKHRVAAFNDSLVVFQDLAPGTYTIVQLSDDRRGYMAQAKVPVGQDPSNSVTIAAGEVGYLGKLTSIGVGDGMRAQAWDVDTEAGAWAAVLDKHHDSPWQPIIEERLTELAAFALEPPLVRLERTIEQFETTSGALDTPSVSGGLPGTRSELDAYLDDNPGDCDAAVLSARLKILEELAEPVMFSPGDELNDPFTEQQTLMDACLARDESDSRAHYWKARMYGFMQPGMSATGRMAHIPVDLGKAIEHASRALELSPGHVDYMMALSLYYVEDMRWDEAAQTVDCDAGRTTPLYMLLRDAASIPLPEGAVYSQADSYSFGEMQLERGRIADFPQVRVRVYVAPMTAEEVGSFYAEVWEGFEFVVDAPDQPGGAQYLRRDGDGWMPMPAGSVTADLDAAVDRENGVVVSVMEAVPTEGEPITETAAGHELPDAFGDTFCYLFFVDRR